MVEVSGISILLSGWMIVDLGDGGCVVNGNWKFVEYALRCNSIDSV